jgi:hypothetical protein
MKLLNVLLISCRRASELVHKKHNQGLNRKENLKLKVHTTMCSACKTFENQTDQIEVALKQKLNESAEIEMSSFNQETVSKLKM